MSHVIGETMSILINSVDYSNFIDSISVSGGNAIYNYKQMYNSTYKKVISGYTNWDIKIKMLVSTDTKEFIDNLNDQSINYVIESGDSLSVTNTYSNLSVSDFSDSMSVGELQLIEITFNSVGLRENKV